MSISCPNCGAPLAFRSTASAAVVCGSCSSTIARDNDTLKKIGSVSAFDRSLSPIQIGSSGRWRSKSFWVVGVLRKERENVRWNEWYVIYDDGTGAWLSDGNGEFHIYDGKPISGSTVPRPETARLGSVFTLLLEGSEATSYQGLGKLNLSLVCSATEISTAAIVAASGELPYPVVQGEKFAYVDVRVLRVSKPGATESLSNTYDVGTIDLELSDGGSATPQFWPGKIVGLTELELADLVPFEGWDHAAASRTPGKSKFGQPLGVKVSSNLALSCTNCGAPLVVRNPASAISISCEYCDTLFDLTESSDQREGELKSSLVAVSNAAKAVTHFSLPLGWFVHLEQTDWEIIGAMVRSVNEDGVDYCWEEYFLFNPYVGHRWLVHSADSWSWVRRLSVLPSIAEGSDISIGVQQMSRHGVRFRSSEQENVVESGGHSDVVLLEDLSLNDAELDVKFNLYARGIAKVRVVIGEFTSRVRNGDVVDTADYICPPFMLSAEREKSSAASEMTWSIGRWISGSELSSALRNERRKSVTSEDWTNHNQKVATQTNHAYQKSSVVSEILVRVRKDMALGTLLMEEGELWKDGIAPHRPNPWDRKVMRSIMITSVVAVLFCLLFNVLFTTLLPSLQPVYLNATSCSAGSDLPVCEAPFRTMVGSANDQESLSDEVFVSKPFKLKPKAFSKLKIDYRVYPVGDTKNYGAKFLQTHVSLLNLTDQSAYKFNDYRTNGSGTIKSPPDGTYVFHINVLKNPKIEKGKKIGKVDISATATLSPQETPSLLCPIAFLIIAGVLIARSKRSGFESKRWEDSNV